MCVYAVDSTGWYGGWTWSAGGHQRRHPSAPGADGEPLIPGCERVKHSIIERAAIWFHRLPLPGRGWGAKNVHAVTVRAERRTSQFGSEASVAAGAATGGGEKSPVFSGTGSRLTIEPLCQYCDMLTRGTLRSRPPTPILAVSASLEEPTAPSVTSPGASFLVMCQIVAQRAKRQTELCLPVCSCVFSSRPSSSSSDTKTAKVQQVRWG